MVSVTNVAGVVTYTTSNELIRPVEAVGFAWVDTAGTPGGGVAVARIPGGVKVNGTFETGGRLAELPRVDRTPPDPVYTLNPVGSIVPDVAADLEPVLPPTTPAAGELSPDTVEDSLYRHGSAYDDPSAEEDSVDDEPAGDGQDPPPREDVLEQERDEADRLRRERERESAAAKWHDDAEHHRAERERAYAEAMHRRHDQHERLRRMAEPDGYTTAAMPQDPAPPSPTPGARPAPAVTPVPPSAGATTATAAPKPIQPETSHGSGSGDRAVTPEHAAVTPSPAESAAATTGTVTAGSSRPVWAGGGRAADAAAGARAAMLANPPAAVRAAAGGAPLDVFTLIRPA